MPWRKITTRLLNSSFWTGEAKEIRFKNEASIAVIKELILRINHDGGYEIIVALSNTGTYNKFIAQAKTVGLPVTDNTNTKDFLYRIRCNDLIPHGVVLFNVVNALEASFLEIKEEVSQLLNIDLNRSYTLPNWLVSGFFHRGEVTFINASPKAIVSQISLLKSDNRDYEIIARASNKDAYNKLIAETKRLGLPESNFFDKLNFLFRVRCNSLIPIGVLLKAIEALEPIFNEIKGQLSQGLNIDLDCSYKVSNWLVYGSFQQGVLVFTNTSPTATVKRLIFNIQSEGNKIAVAVSNLEAYKKLFDKATDLGFPIPPRRDVNMLVFTATFNDFWSHAPSLFEAIKTIESQFIEIESDIIRELNIDVTPIQRVQISSSTEDINNLYDYILTEIEPPLLPCLKKLSRRNAIMLPSLFNSINNPNADHLSINPSLFFLSTQPFLSQGSSSINPTKTVKQPGLNNVQKRIIDGTLHYPFNLIDDLKNVDDKILVLNLILKDTLSPENILFLKSLDILEVVEQVREILKHSYPQNRAVDYPYHNRKGVPEGDVIFKNERGEIKSEPKGLLGLTAYGDESLPPPTKEDVCLYISQLIAEKIAELEELKKQPDVEKVVKL